MDRPGQYKLPSEFAGSKKSKTVNHETDGWNGTQWGF